MTGTFWRRLVAIIVKEVQQLRRDRLTFAMMFGVPIMQLLLFGYAIDTDPHHLPTAVIAADDSTVTRTVVAALQSTGYMTVTHRPASQAEASQLLQSGEVQFVVTIPSDFTRRLVRGERAQILIDADATDPLAAANPLAIRRSPVTWSARWPACGASRAASRSSSSGATTRRARRGSTSCPACWRSS